MVNAHGVIVDYERIRFTQLAHVGVGEHEGKWYHCINYTLALQGHGYAPSINSRRTAHGSKEDAIEAGKEELLKRCDEIINGRHTPTSDHKGATDVKDALLASRQMDLF